MTILSSTEIEKILSDTEESFPHAACNTCECFLGFVTQLNLDSNSSCESLLIPYKPKPGEIHSCMGCDPCPPGDRFAAYMSCK